MKKQEQISVEIPTPFGVFTFSVWDRERGRELVALSSVTLDPHKEVMVRIHSECLTGDTFGSYTCDCGPQRDLALQMIQQHGNGVFIYHRQEGRNAGLFRKIQGYNLMRSGKDTHEAYLELIGHPDPREYSDVLSVMESLLGGQKSRIQLLTNNPYKILFLERYGYPVVAMPLQAGASFHNSAYMESKTQKFLHNSIGYGPYVGATLFREDIMRQGKEIACILQDLTSFHSNRKVFLGVALSSERGDLKDDSLARDLNAFYKKISDVKRVSLVLHLTYPAERQNQRDLARFLDKLAFAYSLQFRLVPHTSHPTKVDPELLDSFHAEHLIFQLKEEHFYLLEQRGVAEYFRLPNKFLLVDESWGTGILEDASATREKILKLVSRGLSRVAVAGGYGPENVSRIGELEDYFKIPISVDAESKLRTGGALDLSKLKMYLSHSFPHRV